MAPRKMSVVDRRRYKEVSEQIQRLSDRIDETDQRAERLENTLKGVLREIDDISIGSRCSSCDESLLIIQNGMMHCPECGFQRSM